MSGIERLANAMAGAGGAAASVTSCHAFTCAAPFSCIPDFTCMKNAYAGGTFTCTKFDCELVLSKDYVCNYAYFSCGSTTVGDYFHCNSDLVDDNFQCGNGNFYCFTGQYTN
jgi:hypothetical protein